MLKQFQFKEVNTSEILLRDVFVSKQSFEVIEKNLYENDFSDYF